MACVLIGYPCAYVLARQVKGRAREALFLLIILPFWSNSLVRIFSWAIVLRGNGIIDHTLGALLPFVSVNLMFSYTAVVIGLVHSYLPYVILTSYLALQAIDESILEAARSLGLTSNQSMFLVILPQALRILIPPLTSQYLNIIKSTTLGAAIAYPEILQIFARTVLNQSGRAVEVMTLVLGVFLVVNLLTSAAMNYWNRRLTLQGR